jgi:nicotinamide-nucleotide amidase
VLKVAGLGESAVDHRIGHLIASMSNPTVGVLAHPGQVDVRITAKSTNTEAALELIAPVEKELNRLLGRTIFARDSKTMEDVIGEILENQQLTVAVYEDLTAGALSQRIVEAAGDRFIGGIIGNGMSSIRDVLPQELKNHQMAYLLRDRSLLTPELARSVKERSGADVGLAVHGNPEGDALVENLAAGKTFISVAREGSVDNGVHNFAGRGLPDRTRASLAALDFLRTTLLNEA